MNIYYSFSFIVLWSCLSASLEAADVSDDKWLKFCTFTTNVFSNETSKLASSKSSSSVGLDFSIPNSALAAAAGVPLGTIPGLGNALGNTNIGFSSSDSHENNSTSWADLRSSYEKIDCESVLKAYSQVTIAEIDADKENAIARLELEKSNYQQDTLKAIALINSNVQYEKIKSDVDISKYNADTQKDIAIHSNNTGFNATVLNNTGQVQNEITRGNSDKMLEFTKRREEATAKVIESNQKILDQKEQDAKQSARSKFQY